MHLERVTLHRDRFPTEEHYPFDLEVLQRTPSIELNAPVTFFVGENGSGKSTLLRAICRRSGIHIWEGVVRPRHRPNPHEKQLHRAIDLEWSNGTVPGSLFASELFQNFAHLVDEWASATPEVFEYFGGDSLVTQSHGQSLMAFFRSRYRIRGIYFLDEPETALSPRSQLELLSVLRDMGRAGHAQFIVATHSPILLACPGAEIYTFDRTPVARIAYESTEHFRVYRDFMACRDRFLGED